jgi:deoxyribonuclease-4
MSIAGGLHKALQRGAACGCDVIQLFTKSNVQWATRPLTDDDLAAWQQAVDETGVVPAMVHDSYLINVASPDRAMWSKSLRALADEYARCAALGIPNLVMHPGAHMGRGEGKGIERIARALNRLHADQPDNPTVICLENTAGQGTNLGYRFEHLRDILAAVDDPSRAGICIDTCHTLAAGYDIGTPDAWDQTIDELDTVVGVDQVRCFHVNDSKKPLGSRVDRHDHLGHGFVGLSAFRCLVNDPRLDGLPMTLETPKPTDHSDPINLAILRNLRGKKRVTPTARRLADQAHDRPPAIAEARSSARLRP